MNERLFNLKFVAEVEKLPVLYNYKLKGYSKKDVTEKAWNVVAKEVQISAKECKEKWKNLRSVFVRHLKPAASGSGANSKKPYYLSEAMKFTLPFIKTVIKPEGYLPEVTNDSHPTPIESQVLSEDTCLTDDKEEDSPSSPLFFDVHSSHSVTQDDLPQTSTPVIGSALKRKRNMITDVDKSFKEFMDAKIEKLRSENKDPAGKKTFLLSLLPEIEPLTDSQMRSFRREVLRLIDNIRDNQNNEYQVLHNTPLEYSPYPFSSISSLHGDEDTLHVEKKHIISG